MDHPPLHELDGPELAWPIFAAVHERLMARGSLAPGAIDEVVYTIWLVERCDGEVRNGGVGQLFFNLGRLGVEGPAMVTALRRVGADDAADIIESRWAWLSQRGRKLELTESNFFDAPSSVVGPLSAVSRRWFALEPGVRVRLGEWVHGKRAHPAVRALLDSGEVEVSAPFNGRSQLHQAVDDCNLSWFRRLLADGVDPNAVDHSGEAPLVLLVRHNEPTPLRSTLLSELLAAGADPNARDEHGDCLLQLAAAHPAFVQPLLDAGARVASIPLTAVESAPIARLILAAGADPDAVDEHHARAVHMAAFQGRTEVLAALLDAGADPNAPVTGARAFGEWVFAGATALDIARLADEPVCAALLEAAGGRPGARTGWTVFVEAHGGKPREVALAIRAPAGLTAKAALALVKEAPADEGAPFEDGTVKCGQRVAVFTAEADAQALVRLIEAAGGKGVLR